MPTPTSYDNKALFLQVGIGDEMAFRAVFDQYKAPFHAAAFRMTRSADIAEDIVQEVFIILWNKRVQVAAAKEPAVYLFKILHHSIYAQFRRLAQEKRLQLHLVDAVEEPDDNPVEALLLAKENRQLFDNVISRMPRQQQLVYRLSKQEGLSREAIAAKLAISPNTVKNHLAAAMDFIREYFKKDVSALVWLAICYYL